MPEGPNAAPAKLLLDLPAPAVPSLPPAWSPWSRAVSAAAGPNGSGRLLDGPLMDGGASRAGLWFLHLPPWRRLRFASALRAARRCCACCQCCSWGQVLCAPPFPRHWAGGPGISLLPPSSKGPLGASPTGESPWAGTSPLFQDTASFCPGKNLGCPLKGSCLEGTDLGYRPKSTCLGVSPIELCGIYS